MTSPELPFFYRLYGAPTLGPAIKELRHATGLSQEELARKAGVHRTYLSNLEQGRFSEQLRRLFDILHAMDVDLTLTSTVMPAVVDGDADAAVGAGTRRPDGLRHGYGVTE